MSEQSDTQKELKVQKGIRQAEDELVTLIQYALDNTKYAGLEESQFRNLVRVADTSESVEAIKNFIRYQVGRDNKKWGRGKGSLAEKIIEDIDGNLKKTAQIIAECCETDYKHTWLELIRRYLGYGARHLKYLKDGKV
jgi:hypothetical protein